VSAPPALPLNDFQRVMRAWEAFQPFNGVDVIEARAPVRADALRAAAETELDALGVCYPVARPDGRSVEYRPGPARVPVEVNTTAELAGACSAELNYTFAPGDALVRLWVAGGAHVGMTWQHWPIDGVSASHLFRRILARYAGAPVSDEPTATAVIDPGPVPLPWRGRQKLAVFAREWANEPLAYSRLYHVRRPRPDRTRLCVRLLALPHPPRPAGATLNDVVSAALLWALAGAFPARGHSAWRQNLGLYHIHDLRPYGTPEHARAWGQFLGYTMTHLHGPRPPTMRALIDLVRARTLRLRELNAQFVSLSALRTLRTGLQVMPRGWRWRLPYAAIPGAAGLTATRFRAEWGAPPFAQHFGRSWRVAPLGGLVPFGANLCSKGNDVSLALTYESGGPVAERIGSIEAELRAALG